MLAWRNAWQKDEMNAMVDAARNEIDLVTREKLYHDIQSSLQMDSPYVIMFQQTEASVLRKEVNDYVSGSLFDLIFYRNINK